MKITVPFVYFISDFIWHLRFASVFINVKFNVSEPPGKSKSTTFSVLKKVYSQHGLTGVFAGLTPRLVKVAPACAIMVSSFEYGKAFFERHNRLKYASIES